MSGPTPRQTATFLKERFAQLGLRPETRYGQNFLIDLNLLELLVDSAQLDVGELALEVGTGTGSLTARLAQRAGQVVTVEVDRKLAAAAEKHLAALPNITMLAQDVLKNKNQIHPRVLETVQTVMAEHRLSAYKLVANLPYHIATPLISNLLLVPQRPVRMCVTIQKEVADRLVATPGTKDYGALSVWVQSVARPEILRVLPPTVFWPRPKVHSAFVRIDDDPDRRARLVDVRFFHDLVRALFLHRRKYLRSVMCSATKGHLPKERVDGILQELGWSPQLRAEQLDIDQLRELAERVRVAVQEGGQAS
jgi:16S rRNA (adenine1518-N6/adenine1519-N6)-dimethyltransferase